MEGFSTRTHTLHVNPQSIAMTMIHHHMDTYLVFIIHTVQSDRQSNLQKSILFNLLITLNSMGSSSGNRSHFEERNGTCPVLKWRRRRWRWFKRKYEEREITEIVGNNEIGKMWIYWIDIMPWVDKLMTGHVQCIYISALQRMCVCDSTEEKK